MFTKILITSASMILSAGLLTGCASTSKPAAKADAGHSVTCAKCEPAWVARTGDRGMKSQHVVYVKQMNCPTCDPAAKARIEQDQAVLHNCPTCKVAQAS